MQLFFEHSVYVMLFNRDFEELIHFTVCSGNWFIINEQYFIVRYSFLSVINSRNVLEQNKRSFDSCDPQVIATYLTYDVKLKKRLFI